MKKVLLATTALAMTAGMAAAQGVSLSGYAEIGVAGGDGEENTSADRDLTFHSDIDITFTLSGETDGGLAFGATIDLDEVGDDQDDGIAATNADGSSVEEQSVFVSGDFGTITMGDTDGAFDWAMTEVWWGTTLTDDHTVHPGANGNAGLDGGLNGQIARYEYAFGDFAVAVSAEVGDGLNNLVDEEIFGLGFKYSTDFGGTSLGFGLGYQTGTISLPSVAGAPTALTVPAIVAAEADLYGVSVSADFDAGFSVRLNYSNVDGDVTGTAATTAATALTAVSIGFEWDHYAIGAAYETGPILVEANWGKYDGSVDGVGDFEADGYGISFNYDLGGGAVVMVGYGSGSPFAFDGTSVEDVSTYSAGLGLSF